MSYLHVLAFKLENEINVMKKWINDCEKKNTADVVRRKIYDISDTPPEYMNNPPQPCRIAVDSIVPKLAHYSTSATNCVVSVAEAEHLTRGVSKYLADSFAKGVIATD